MVNSISVRQILTHFFALFGYFYYNKDMEEQQEKNSDLKTLLVFIFILVAIVGAVWFFGWRANQFDVIKQEEPTIIYTNVNP